MINGQASYRKVVHWQISVFHTIECVVITTPYRNSVNQDGTGAEFELTPCIKTLQCSPQSHTHPNCQKTTNIALNASLLLNAFARMASQHPIACYLFTTTDSAPKTSADAESNTKIKAYTTSPPETVSPNQRVRQIS